MSTYHILVTIDDNYLTPLKVMLKSLFSNNLDATFSIHLIFNNISTDHISDLKEYCNYHHAELYTYYIDEDAFSSAPTSERYSQAMYFRLLASKILPTNIDRILYLDPDILVINSIHTLYQQDIENHLFAAAIHTQLTPLTDQVNKIRLGTYAADGYYNSGVMMMNLKKQHDEISEKELFNYISEHEGDLILPDQDVLNGLYGHKILAIDDSLYNYDTRNFDTYRLWSTGKKDMTWVIQHTVILHFCGRAKPWKKRSAPRFALLYKHYEQLMLRTIYRKKKTF